MHDPDPFASLNPAQRAAVEHGAGPLLVVAGAGSGKTRTLVHRVGRLILDGADPRRILLLTFTRRAASEMTRRAARLVATVGSRSRPAGRLAWSGTFHSIANRLLRLDAAGVGLDPSFTILDRSDAGDLVNLLRSELGLADRARRFPRSATCLAIYSHTVNARRPLEETLGAAFPWCAEHADDLRRLFRAYVEAKLERSVLDYDDLLLYWSALLSEPQLAAGVRERFDHVLVDEYQDTNRLQEEILLALAPDGVGLTVVGDDAQSIYSFRAATVENILSFPDRFGGSDRVTVVTLETNYRSTPPILDACNAVIGQASRGHRKDLAPVRSGRQRPLLTTVEDEVSQADHVADRVLAHREEGIDLRRQAVLFRTSHHADLLEVELGRRNIPYVKYGGLKFLEAAHVKDLLSVLRLAENPRDQLAAFRVFQLLPGIGPAHARRAMDHLAAAAFDPASLVAFRPPSSAADDWTALAVLVARLGDPATAWPGQVGAVRRWYEPHLVRLHDAPHVRAGDLAALDELSGLHPTRERFLTELTLDPPQATGDESGPPLLDEDYLVLSTIHSAKGQEWDVVYVLNAVDGCIPSDMATGSQESIDEERRLLYVAMTRARDALHLIHPLRFHVRQQHRHGDRHLHAPRTRFVPDAILDRFEVGRGGIDRTADDPSARPSVQVDVAGRLRSMW